MNLPTPETLPPRDIRTLVLGRRQRVEGLESKLPELRAAQDAAEVMYHAARQEAALADAPLPSREAIDEAERAVRETEERIAGLKDSITALEPERRAAEDAIVRAQRDAYVTELAAQTIERHGQARRAQLAMDAGDAAERRIVWLHQEIQRLELRVGPPSPA